jgi:hypothetical protein
MLFVGWCVCDCFSALMSRPSLQEKQRESKMAGMGSGSGSANAALSAYGSSDAYSSSSGISSPYADSPNNLRGSDTGSSSLGLPKTTKAAPVKGMSLSAAKGKSLEDALVKEDKLAPVARASAAAASSSSAVSAAPATPAITHPIMLVVAEKISCKMSREGTVSSFEVKGSLTLTANNDESALCSVQMRVGHVENFTFSTHPKVNKAVYDKSGLIQLKDTTKGFPSQRPVG